MDLMNSNHPIRCVYAPLLSESMYLTRAKCGFCYHYWGIGIIIIRDEVIIH